MIRKWRAPAIERGPLISGGLVLLFTALVVHSWQSWGSVRVDAGGALDRAARIAEGQLLYRDVLSPYGPIADYSLAALFRLFGIHLHVAYALGLSLLIAQSWLLWRIGRRFLDDVECAVALAAFWVLFAFQPGLFNWVLPSTFSSTFGAFFATGALSFAISDLERPHRLKLVAASLATAVAGLSKPEFGVAACATLTASALLFPTGGRRLTALAFLLLPGALFSALVAAVLLVLVPWQQLLFDNLFRIRSFAISVPAFRARLHAEPLAPLILQAALRYGAELPLRAAAVAFGLGLFERRGAGRAGGAVIVGTALLIPLIPGYPPLQELALPMSTAFFWAPAVCTIVLVLSLLCYRRSRSPALRTVTMVAGFCILLSFRWRLRLDLPSYHGGFFVLLLMIFIVRVFASGLSRRHTSTAVALVFAVHTVLVGQAVWRFYDASSFTLQYPRGTIRTVPAEGGPMKATIDYLRSHTTDEDYVAVIPEERLINFLAERRHPTKDPGTGPGWLATADDEDEFIRELEEKRTRAIVVSNRAYLEFGTGGFGSYNRRVLQRIRQRYQEVWSSGPGYVQYSIYSRRSNE